MFDSWKDLALAFGGLWLTLVSWIGRREVRRLDAKAERSEVLAMCQRLEKNHETLVERFEKSDKEARESRGKMHDKLDASIKSQTELNLQFARELGRKET